MPDESGWTGTLAFGTVMIPVKVVPAAAEQPMSFHFLHDEDNARLERRMVCRRRQTRPPGARYKRLRDTAGRVRHGHRGGARIARARAFPGNSPSRVRRRSVDRSALLRPPLLPDAAGRGRAIRSVCAGARPDGQGWDSRARGLGPRTDRDRPQPGRRADAADASTRRGTRGPCGRGAKGGRGRPREASAGDGRHQGALTSVAARTIPRQVRRESDGAHPRQGNPPRRCARAGTRAGRARGRV